MRRRSEGRPPKTEVDLLNHARRRALQRFATSISEDEIRDLVGQIRTGKARFVSDQSRTMSVWIVRFGERLLPVVYNRAHQMIATFLTWDMLKTHVPQGVNLESLFVS